MQVMTPKAKLYWLVFLIWFSGASALIFLLSYSNQREFDPKLALSSAIMDLDFETNFAKAAKLELIRDSEGYLVHIGTLNQCACEFIARNHQTSLDRFAEQHNLSSKYIKIENYPDLSAFIPSLPAVAFFDVSGRLKFFGPYSSGAGCFGTYGFIDSYLQAFINEKAPAVASIVTEASGCYCENEWSLK